MIKRPLNARFPAKVKQGIKVTTIRDNAWPVGVPIMLYTWSGAAYRSKQIDVAAVRVLHTHPITIIRNDDTVRFSIATIDGRDLWECEGFDSKKELHDWFLALLKPGQTVTKRLMRFLTLP